MSNGNEEAIKRALESGRDAEDIAKDLADDGLLNNSHLLGSTERLIESNGETQDVIEKATETAKKLQKLLTALIPILLLLATSGLELGGIIDLTPAGADEPFWEDTDDEIYWGCMDEYALNYDEWANEDDGYCEYDTEPEPEPEPEPSCEPFFYDYWTNITDNGTTANFGFDVDIECDDNQDIEVQFLVYANNSTHGDSPENYTIDNYNTTYQDWDTRILSLTVSENRSYDFYAYLINEDGDMMKELIWPDIVMSRQDDF